MVKKIFTYFLNSQVSFPVHRLYSLETGSPASMAGKALPTGPVVFHDLSKRNKCIKGKGCVNRAVPYVKYTLNSSGPILADIQFS